MAGYAGGVGLITDGYSSPAAFNAAIPTDADLDLSLGAWILQSKWLLAKGDKPNAVRAYGDHTDAYVNAVLNCERCISVMPKDEWKDVFNVIQKDWMEKGAVVKCACGLEH